MCGCQVLPSHGMFWCGHDAVKSAPMFLVFIGGGRGRGRGRMNINRLKEAAFGTGLDLSTASCSPSHVVVLAAAPAPGSSSPRGRHQDSACPVDPSFGSILVPDGHDQSSSSASASPELISWSFVQGPLQASDNHPTRMDNMIHFDVMVLDVLGP